MLLSGFALACAHALSAVPPLVDYAFFGVFLIALGIPHGAVDHMIAKQLVETNQRRFSLSRFIGQYILQIVLYAVFWYLFPTVSLLLFILLSAWHFGESDVQPAPSHFSWKLVQFISGSLVLFFILMRQPDLTGEIVQSITQKNRQAAVVWSWISGHVLHVYAGLSAALGCAVVWANTRAPMAFLLRRWGYFAILLGVIFFLPVLPAFALYFGGWHALNTFHHMAGFMGHTNGISALWKASLPFTLMAFVFLFFTAVLWQTRLAHHDPIPVLFIFIAIITLPHLVVMHQMFRRL